MENIVISEVSRNKCYGGFQLVCSHESDEVKCKMTFAVYLPPQADLSNSVKLPVIYWLSGLTCTEQNFIQKSGIQKHAAEHGIIVVGPDTSPRNCNIEGETDSWDFGAGAGFYVDATETKWKDHYKMYSYVTSELVKVVEKNFPADPDRKSIMGHSMGGHGALICYLKNPGKFRSVSAFAPISNPTKSSFGRLAFLGYLGNDENAWKAYDACELVKSYSGPLTDILIDQGMKDEFLPQLLPENFVTACAEAKFPVVLRKQEDYDHSYYFVSTFIGDHMVHHAKLLKE